MPSYSSKSQKSSKSQSKNGGRRKKRTLKNVRRRKSRKVMMGGGDIVTYEQLENKLNNKGVKTAFLQAMGRNDNNFDAFKSDTMMNTQNAETIDLSKIKNVISVKPIYANAVKAIDELIAES